MDIVTLSEVKDYLGIKDTEHDAKIRLIITMVSGEVDEYLGGRILLREDVTHYLDVAPGQTQFFLPLFPVTDVAWVANDADREFASTSEITDTYYAVNMDRGIITLLPGVYVDSGTQALEVTYSGGFGTTAKELRDNHTALWSAVLTECVYRYQRRNEIGVSNLGVTGGAVTLLSKEQFTAQAQAVLDSYCRVLG